MSNPSTAVQHQFFAGLNGNTTKVIAPFFSLLPLVRTCVDNLAFRMQKVQSKEEAMEDESEDRRGQSPHRVAVKEREDALPQRGMYQASVTPVRSGNIERVQQLPNGASTGMLFRRTRNALVHGNLVIQLPAHGLRVHEKLQCHVATTTALPVSRAFTSSRVWQMARRAGISYLSL